MPIYHDGKKMKPYRGYRKPVNIYYGDKKVAGWKNSTQTGNNLTFQTTYNDTADVVVKGKTEQKSEWVHKQGETAQSGTPTPETPIPLISNLPAGTYKTQDWNGDWWEFTLTDDLCGIGDVRDSVEWDKYGHNGRCLNNVIKKIFNGTESIVYTIDSSVNGTNTVAFAWTSTTVKMSQHPISTHFLGQNIWNMDREGVWVGASPLMFNYDLECELDNLKASLTLTNAALQPFTIETVEEAGNVLTILYDYGNSINLTIDGVPPVGFTEENLEAAVTDIVFDVTQVYYSNAYDGGENIETSIVDISFVVTKVGHDPL